MESRFGPSWHQHVRRAALGLILVICSIQIVRIGSADFRDGPVIGDQATHVMQAISIASEGNLSFDSGDVERFAELKWGAPQGLFYQQYEHGYAFAKPYGYSLYAAPLVKVFGPVRGMALANALLVTVLLAAVTAILRHGFEPLVSVFVAAVFTFTTAAYMYGYVQQADLFLAVIAVALTLLAVRYHASERVPYLVAAAVVLGFAMSDKPQFFGVFAPLILVLAWKSDRRRTLLAYLGGAFIASFVVAIVPYLFYSDFEAWNPYSGIRFYSPGGDVPFDSTAATDAVLTAGDQFFSVSYWKDALGDDLATSVESAGYALYGRHTGMLPFYPLAALLILGALYRRRWDPNSVAVVFGIAAYIAFYSLFFPLNYYGGGQSLGNRYLLQIIPLVVALPVFARFPAQFLAKLAGAGALLGLLFLGSHHRSPSNAFTFLSRTSVTQQLFPFEYDRTGELIFACGTWDRTAIIQNGSNLCHEIAGVTVLRTEG